MRLIKAGSMDSLDIYDDRGSVRSGGSGGLASLRGGGGAGALLRDGSRHGGSDGSRGGGTARGASTAVSSPELTVFRFDTARQRDTPGAAAPAAVATGSGGAAEPDGAAGGPWRFDVGGAAAAPPAGPGAAAPGGKAGMGSVAAAAGGACGGGAAHGGAATALVGHYPSRVAGYCDRRMHGSSLYRNVALGGGAGPLGPLSPCGAMAGRLAPVAE
jgi:calcium-dependent protein kinase